ncbi:MAG: type III-A CRISPR-associated RAMP protein Csm3 [Syntrophomonadaceae bacterium]|nr:type III-A CRISPR-associated RAMP protein Csm3 [Syntrophomonadaceae bacterium]
MSEVKMKGKLIIQGRITACTGLHIGGSPAGLDIGGVDNAVIKDQEGKPYIPGSSLKGKMRSLLEKSEGLVSGSGLVVTKSGSSINDRIRMHMCNDPDCAVCNIFGRTNGRKNLDDGSTIEITNAVVPRLLVRDAYLDEDTIPPEVKKHLELEWTEVKYENSIDRITSAANPRQSERVPRGAQFVFQMIFTIFSPQDKEHFKKVIKAMRLLEDDYLGGSGSRGYGQVSFNDIKIYWNSVADYESGNVDLSVKDPLMKTDNLSELIGRLMDNDELSSLLTER